jgi:hypothetical protein
MHDMQALRDATARLGKICNLQCETEIQKAETFQTLPIKRIHAENEPEQASQR